MQTHAIYELLSLDNDWPLRDMPSTVYHTDG